MRILVLRARPDGEETAARIAALGHEAVQAPVLEILPTLSPAPAGPFDATIATSAHGLVSAAALSQALRDKPFFVVGSRTASAAAAAGFTDLRCASDASALAGLIVAALDRATRLLYLAGRDRKPVLEATLAKAGISPVVHVVYDAVPTRAWADSIVEDLRAGRVDAVLHFSNRSASLSLELAEHHGVRPAFLALQHYCLSEDVSEPLLGTGARRVAVAPRPDSASLLALINAPPLA